MANGNGKERELGVILEKLENLEEGQKDLKTTVDNGFDKMNNRVRKNEVKIAYIFGGLGVLTIAITLVRLL